MVKHLHMTTAGLSLLGFLIRGYWMFTGNRLLRTKAVKILPHIIDTLLLASAIYLMIILRAYPFVIDWVTAKVLLLVVYIIAGTVALKTAKTKSMRVKAFFIGLITILSIFAIAFMKPTF